MINNLTMSKLAVKGDAVIGSFAVFSLVLSSVVTFTLTSFFATILPVKRNLLTYLDGALVFSLHIGIMSQVALSGIMSSFQGLCRIVQKSFESFLFFYFQCGGTLLKILIKDMPEFLAILWSGRQLSPQSFSPRDVQTSGDQRLEGEKQRRLQTT